MNEGMAVERWLANLLFGLLVRRGWAVRVNEPDSSMWDDRFGWRPLFSIRYGKTPVFRGPGEVRWRG